MEMTNVRVSAAFCLCAAIALSTGDLARNATRSPAALVPEQPGHAPLPGRNPEGRQREGHAIGTKDNR
jgi:hypothetical protein